MARRFFSDVPLMASMSAVNNMISKPWAQWFRDLYARVNKNAEDILSIEAGAVVDHNDLDGLQGGSPDERNHLSNDQVSAIASNSAGVSTNAANIATNTANIDDIQHNEINGLQGGTVGERYHFTEEEHSILSVLSLDNTIQDSTSSIYTEIQSTTDGADELIQNVT